MSKPRARADRGLCHHSLPPWVSPAGLVGAPYRCSGLSWTMAARLEAPACLPATPRHGCPTGSMPQPSLSGLPFSSPCGTEPRVPCHNCRSSKASGKLVPLRLLQWGHWLCHCRPKARAPAKWTRGLTAQVRPVQLPSCYVALSGSLHFSESTSKAVHTDRNGQPTVWLQEQIGKINSSSGYCSLSV